MIRFSLLLILSIGAFSAWSQDTLHSSSPARRLEPTDSITVRNGRKVMTIESYAARFDPRKAMLYSAALPGLGQAYNKKYWKIPLIYGAFGGLGFAVWWNNDRYLFYRAGLFGLLNEPANPTVDPVTNLTKFGNPCGRRSAFVSSECHQSTLEGGDCEERRQSFSTRS